LQITSVELLVGGSDGINVPVAVYEELVKSLFPAKVDRWPKKWRSFGELRINTDKGTWTLDIYKAHEDPGAFGIWPPSGWQTYLRCRTNAEMSNLVSTLQAMGAENERETSGDVAQD
jgi:hypothetical protein